MKKFTLMMVVGVLVFLGMSFEASAAPMCDPGLTSDRPDVGPWPFGLEQPFPWRSIQGVWVAQVDGCDNEFVFKVARPDNRGTQLRIHQIDPVDCSLVAEGVGFEQNRVVRAQLMGKNGPQELKIHVFSPADVPDSVNRDFTGLNRNFVVMTLAPLGRPKSKTIHQLTKLSTDVKKVCEL